MATGPRGAEAMLFLAAVALCAILALWIAMRLARRSRRPKVKRPPKRTFEHGRRLAHERRAGSTVAALAALERSPVGELVARGGDDRRVDVVLRRKRSQPCEQAAGFVAGIFESAWAHEVIVTHPSCAGPRGGECAYTVHRVATPRAARTAPASTPGSGDGRRRSRRARPGGG